MRKFIFVFTLSLWGSYAFAANQLGDYPHLESISEWLISPPGYISLLVSFAWDLLRRFWPTFQPAGLLHDIAYLLSALGHFLDTLLPQNVIPAPPPEQLKSSEEKK